MFNARELDRFVGIPYSAAEFDCADFVSYVRQELFGHSIVMPSRRPRGLQGQVQLAQLSTSYVSPVDGAPIDGDLVLMRDLGHRRAGHVGLYFCLGGTPWVLHNTDMTGGSVLHRTRDLGNLGLIVEGYYRWKT